MNVSDASKSARANLIEGIALLALFQAFPLLTAAALLLKLTGSGLVSQPGGAAIFVVMSSIVYAVIVAFVGPKYPKQFAAVDQPMFFDAGLTLREKIQRWRIQPERSSQLLALVMMLSVLAVVVMCVG